MLRSLVSRAYYAAYSWVTYRLVKTGMTRFGGRQNPGHHELQKLARTRLTALSSRQRRNLAQIIRRMWKRRVIADYIPRQTVDRELAHGVLRDLAALERLLGDGQ